MFPSIISPILSDSFWIELLHKWMKLSPLHSTVSAIVRPNPPLSRRTCRDEPLCVLRAVDTHAYAIPHACLCVETRVYVSSLVRARATVTLRE